jgi:hypothetical protein
VLPSSQSAPWVRFLDSLSIDNLPRRGCVPHRSFDTGLTRCTLGSSLVMRSDQRATQRAVANRARSPEPTLPERCVAMQTAHSPMMTLRPRSVAIDGFRLDASPSPQCVAMRNPPRRTSTVRSEGVANSGLIREAARRFRTSQLAPSTDARERASKHPNQLFCAVPIELDRLAHLPWNRPRCTCWTPRGPASRSMQNKLGRRNAHERRSPSR